MNFRVNEIASKIKGSFLCSMDGVVKEYASTDDLCKAVPEKYVVEEIAVKDGKVLLTVDADKIVKNDMNADWVKEHKAKYGVEPNPFD